MPVVASLELREIETASETSPLETLEIVTGATAVLGRDSACDLVLPTIRASRRHFEIVSSVDGELRLRDLGSTNGVRLNGELVRGEVDLAAGDRIVVGEYEIRVRTATSPAVTADPPAPSHRRIHALEIGLALILLAIGLGLGYGVGVKLARRLSVQDSGATPSNLAIPDASFESTDPGLGAWTATSFGGAFRVDRVLGGSSGDGEMSLEVAPASRTLPGDRCVVAAPQVQVRDGETLCASVDVRLDSGAGPATVALELIGAGGASQSTLHAMPVDQGGAWRRLECCVIGTRGSRAARIQLVAFGGGEEGQAVRFDDVRVHRSRGRSPDAQLASWETPALQAGLRARVDGAGGFHLSSGLTDLVLQGVLLAGDRHPFDPVASAALASRRKGTMQAGAGSSLVVSFPGAGNAEVVLISEQSAQHAFVARAAISAHAIGELPVWALELPAEALVHIGEEHLAAGDLPGRQVRALTITVDGSTLDLALSSAAAVRLDPIQRGLSLALAFPELAGGASGEISLSFSLR